MLSILKKYIETQELCGPDDKLLVAVSGGIDSIVLLHLLQKGSYSCAIAHCNFQLRAQESDEDEVFVKSIGEKYGLKTHVIRFDTGNYALENGISTQMAARELRYNWFAELFKINGYDKIVIAHNADDSIETFHLNLARGTGLSGITGISAKSGNFIRPLLWAARKEITNYCEIEKLTFREDSSNQKTDYKRNYLRHEILPKFKRLNPSYSETMLNNIEFFKQSSIMLDHYYQDLIIQLVEKSGKEVRLNILKLNELAEPSWFLFKFLSPFGFNSTQTRDINISLNSQSGKQFTSASHLLVRDRDQLILCELSNSDIESYTILGPNGKIFSPIDLEWEVFNSNNYRIIDDPSIASIDASKLKFPLLIRKWEKGDSFYPLGMNGLKKLSDYFIDNKISIIEKEKIWILLSDNKIVWIIGNRIDNRFKISSKTQQILRIKLN